MKSKVAAALFAIFLGGFGIHKFYLEKVGQGVLYLIFCWTLIPAIIGFIEGIVYLAMSEDSFNFSYNRRYTQQYRPQYFQNNPPADPLTCNVSITSYSTGLDGHLDFSVSGTIYRNQNEIRRMGELAYAEELKMITEPENPYDPYAIAIYTMDDSLIGYVPKGMTHLMREPSGMLKKYRCVFTKRTEHNPPFIYVRVDFLK